VRATPRQRGASRLECGWFAVQEEEEEEEEEKKGARLEKT
jgi:hypothetical protein